MLTTMVFSSSVLSVAKDKKGAGWCFFNDFYEVQGHQSAAISISTTHTDICALETLPGFARQPNAGNYLTLNS